MLSKLKLYPEKIFLGCFVWQYLQALIYIKNQEISETRNRALILIMGPQTLISISNRYDECFKLHSKKVKPLKEIFLKIFFL